ncbi:HK97-gp10 family putative phage morphogenesis protein [Qipengyuania sp.]|uniref:HK97-gp10 family putative phage morphogenesis protein n=1 Tax=Qipengyuania sp. TaxID=2004515 RepID=UPI0035C8480E
MKFEITGFKELDKALADLPKATERAVLRRVAKKALEPMLDRAKQLVPVDEGDLQRSLVIGSSLSKRARRADRKEPRQGLRLFMGTNSRNGVPREFGTVRTVAQPYMRPAWDSFKQRSLNIILSDLSIEVDKAAERAARKRARQSK